MNGIMYYIYPMVSVTFSSLCSITLVISVLVVINIVQVLVTKKRNYKKLKEELGYPVPPMENFLFAHMDEFGHRENEVRWHKQLGKVFGFYNCDAAQLRVADLDLVNEIFLKQNKLFNSRTWTEYRLRAILKSILMNKGHNWKKSRRIIQPALAEYRIKKNDTHIDDIKNGLDKMIKFFNTLVGAHQLVDGDEASHEPGTVKDHDYSQYAKRGFMSIDNEDSPTGIAIDMNAYDVMQIITLDVIYRLAFNLDHIDVIKGADEPALKIIRSIMRQAEGFSYKLASAIPILRVILFPYMRYKLLKSYREFVSSIVDHTANISREQQKAEAANRSGPRRIHNILWDEFKAGNLTRGEVRANTMAILVAGFETTATTSSYVLWCIAKHVECTRKLYADILNYGLESKYLDMFIKEVMRMYPALPNFVIRTPHQDAQVGGYTIKRGMSVYMSVSSIHYDESIWENPHRFDPERFAEGKTYPPGAYAPFGLGHRMCAGYQLALREMKTIVCELLTNFELKLIAPAEMITECSSIFLTRPKHEIRLRLIPRPRRRSRGSVLVPSCGEFRRGPVSLPDTTPQSSAEPRAQSPADCSHQQGGPTNPVDGKPVHPLKIDQTRA